MAAPALAHPTLSAALAERGARSQRLRVTLAPSAAGYVAGEETAVLAHLEGRPPRPRLTRHCPPTRDTGGARPSSRTSRPSPTSGSSPGTAARGFARPARRTPRHDTRVGVRRRSRARRLRGPVGHPAHGGRGPRGRGVQSHPRSADGRLLRRLGRPDAPRLTLDDAALEPYGAAVGAGVVVVLGTSSCAGGRDGAAGGVPGRRVGRCSAARACTASALCAGAVGRFAGGGTARATAAVAALDRDGPRTRRLPASRRRCPDAQQRPAPVPRRSSRSMPATAPVHAAPRPPPWCCPQRSAREGGRVSRRAAGTARTWSPSSWSTRRVRWPRPVRRAAARADRLGRLGLSDRRSVDPPALHEHAVRAGQGVPGGGPAIAGAALGGRRPGPSAYDRSVRILLIEDESGHRRVRAEGVARAGPPGRLLQRRAGGRAPGTARPT